MISEPGTYTEQSWVIWLNTYGRLDVAHCSPPPSNEGICFGKMVFVPRVEFYTLGESITRCTEAVLEAPGGPTPY